jgi:hypothetical protein
VLLVKGAEQKKLLKNAQNELTERQKKDSLVY